MLIIMFPLTLICVGLLIFCFPTIIVGVVSAIMVGMLKTYIAVRAAFWQRDQIH